LRDEKNELTGYLATLSEITESKQVEQQLRASHEQLRALTARTLSAREEECTRISREIHDVMGQLLTRLRLDVHVLEDRCATVRDHRLRSLLAKQLRSTDGLVETLFTTVHGVASELRPAMLTDLGLAAALRSEIQGFQRRTGIRCRLALEPLEQELEAERATTAFRIFQEALTNVARHAHASRLVVRLVQQDGQLALTICDNGCGIKPDSTAALGSIGLLGMRERAAVFGGEVTFLGRPKKGTTVTVRIPLAGPS
jgi:signal transduction histidine kinase